MSIRRRLGKACGRRNLHDKECRENAAKAIAESETFTGCHFAGGIRDICDSSIYTGRWNLIVRHWASTSAHLQPDNLKGSAVGYWLYTNGYLQLSPNDMLTLSDKGRIASKGWKHVTAPGREAETSQTNFEGWDIPLATKHFIAITSVFRGWRMGVQFAEVHYLWSYALTPLGSELFKNERLSNHQNKCGRLDRTCRAYWYRPAQNPFWQGNFRASQRRLALKP